jgi:hypothetical protein
MSGEHELCTALFSVCCVSGLPSVGERFEAGCFDLLLDGDGHGEWYGWVEFAAEVEEPCA